MKLVAFAIAALLLTSCGDDGDYNNQDENIASINSRIARHGHPITSSDQYGHIFFVACDTNQVIP